MKIIDLLKNKKQDLYGQKPVTIAFLGDSVTQGCFECYLTNETSIQTVFDYKSAYSTRVKEILNILYPEVQINIINSGISGDSTAVGATRIERDVLPFNPDLCVVSYGLNDSCGGDIQSYKNSLDKIFKTLKSNDIETIFLTQNAMCDHVSCHLTDKLIKDLAANLSLIQNNGSLKEIFDAAKSVCRENGVTVCDLHPVWEKLFACGVDTTELLANKLNHPIREYHYYIAIKLIETMFGI